MYHCTDFPCYIQPAAAHLKDFRSPEHQWSIYQVISSKGVQNSDDCLYNSFWGQATGDVWCLDVESATRLPAVTIWPLCGHQGRLNTPTCFSGGIWLARTEHSSVEVSLSQCSGRTVTRTKGVVNWTSMDRDVHSTYVYVQMYSMATSWHNRWKSLGITFTSDTFERSRATVYFCAFQAAYSVMK
jgi:hypothetical protein